MILTESFEVVINRQPRYTKEKIFKLYDHELKETFLNNDIKIKYMTVTEFGIDILLVKKYQENKILSALNQLEIEEIVIRNNSIFIPN